MTKHKTPVLPEHYHELKMSGAIGPNFVEELFETALAVSLGRPATPVLSRIPLDDLQLYDVSHFDTGERRVLNKSGDTTPVYQSLMRKITHRVPKAPLLILDKVVLDKVGGSDSARKGTSVQINGRLDVELSDADVSPGFSAEDVDAIRETLQDPQYPPVIYGRLVVGRAFHFGRAEFRQPPNENYDDLVTIGAFHDHRSKPKY